MPSSFTKKAATIMIGLLFLLITISFIFGDYQNQGSASPQDVASVNGYTISPREFQMRLSQQVEFFNQMMGGKLTQQQLEQMGIKETVLNQLIQSKLLLSFASKNGFNLSGVEVKEEIRKLPYFQREGKFDVGLYRNLLNGNQYSPSQFEEMIHDESTTRKVEIMLNAQLVSEGLASDILRFKMSGIRAEAVRIERQNLVSLVTVSPQEAQEFADKKENQKVLEDLYQDNLAKYSKPEEVKARHILFKAEAPGEDTAAKAKADKLAGTLTAKNFAEQAKALSEDPTGKKDGGDLGWFSRGRMVPEFEEAAFKAQVGQVVGPVKSSFGYHWILVEGKKGEEKKTLEQVKLELATMTLQKRKTTELEQLMSTTKTRFTDWLTKADIQAINNEKSRLTIGHFPGTEVNLYDLSVGPHALTPEEGKKLFEAPVGTVLDFSTPGSIFLVRVGEKLNQDVEAKIKEQVKAEVQSQSSVFARKLREEVLKELNAQAKVVTNPAFL